MQTKTENKFLYITIFVLFYRERNNKISILKIYIIGFQEIKKKYSLFLILKIKDYFILNKRYWVENN